MCENFALHARDTITFGGSASEIHNGGDVGVSPGDSIGGVVITEVNPTILDGGSYIESDSSDFTANVASRHAFAITQQAHAKFLPAAIGGMTFTPGLYRAASEIGIVVNMKVTLNGPGVYIFQAHTAMTTGADTEIVLTNGATAENVLWVLGSALTLGANSIIQGSITTGTAVTFGADSHIYGCVLAQTAITFPSHSEVTWPLDASGRRSLAGVKQVNPDLKTAGDYESLAKTAPSSLGQTYINTNDGSATAPNGHTSGAIVAMEAAYADVADRPNDDSARIDLGDGILGGAYGGLAAKLTPGIYTFNTGVSVTGDIYIEGTGTAEGEGQGDTDVFIIQVKGNLVQSSKYNMYLLNGALAKNIFWQVEGSVTVGAGAHMAGILLANTDVTFGTDSSLDGRVLSLAGITKLPSTIAEPSVCRGDVENPDSNPHISAPGLTCCPEAPECVLAMSKTGDTVCPNDTEAVVLIGTKTEGGSVVPSGSHIDDIIYDISFSGDSIAPEVSFKVNNPFSVPVDMYVEHDKKVGSLGAKDPSCSKDLDLGPCKTDALDITAACMRPSNELSFAVVSVYFVSTEACFGEGSDATGPFVCCEQPESTKGDPFVKYTFKILCECPVTSRRLGFDFLRGRNNHFHDSL
jgi:hypothetical protein